MSVYKDYQSAKCFLFWSFNQTGFSVHGTGVGKAEGLKHPPVFNSGEWHHSVLVLSDDSERNATIYLNGILLGAINCPLNKGSVTDLPFRIGNRGPDERQNPNVYLDDVRIYNRALSEAEVKVLYDYESTGSPNQF